jgi:uncharacterized protein (DUF2461 family)
MPKGFACDDPGDELVRAKCWAVRASLPAELALEPVLAREVVRRLQLMAPLVDTLNDAILQSGEGSAQERSGSGLRSFF